MSWHNDQVSDLETKKILSTARDCLMVEGDFVELGCYKGDTSLMLAEILQGSDKKLWIYDSFEGLPEKKEEDESAVGVDFKKGELAVSKREVKERFLRAGILVPRIKKAWFSELIDEDLPEKIAFAFLDGDLYESIKDSLRLVQNKVMPGGVIIIHDYVNEALPGVARAVDEWICDKNYKLTRYESLAMIMIK